MTSHVISPSRIEVSLLYIILIAIHSIRQSSAFLPQFQSPNQSSVYQSQSIGVRSTSTTPLHMIKIGKNYKPKWKKKKTLAEESGTAPPPASVGLTGSVTVVFKMGDETRTSVANVGDPLQDVASQAGQYIKYGCGKGECGTCESLCNGQWIRPCTAVVPADYDVDGSGQYVIQVKEVKNKAKSSGMVITKRAAKKNYEERIEYEEMVKQRALEKKRLAALNKEEVDSK